jgi:putative spermidine/putrescine transport system permease protein
MAWIPRPGRGLVLSLPIIGLLGLFFVVPLALVLSLAFRPYDATTLLGTGVTLDNLWRFLGDASYLGALARTVGISLATAVACVVLAFPLAWHLHETPPGARRLWLTLVVLLPLMVSLVVASFAWVLILGNNGLVNALLQALGLVDAPVRLLNTLGGVIAVSTFSHVSYAVLTIFAALENIEPSLLRAARIHGASEAAVMRRIVLPLSLPGLLSGFLIVFALSMAAFVIPFLIGGGRVNVVPLLIYQFTMQFFDWPGSAALSVILLTVTLLATFAIATLAQRWMPWERAR